MSDDPALPVQASNIESLPITIGTVSLQDFFMLRGPSGYDLMQNYRPADAQSWEQFINAPANESVITDVYLSPDKSPLTPGLYFLRLNAPNLGNTDSHVLLVSSNVQLTLKKSPTDALVWAVNLRDGSPVANAPLTLYAEDGSALAAGQTDSDGVFQAGISTRQDMYASLYAVLGQPGADQFGLV